MQDQQPALLDARVVAANIGVAGVLIGDLHVLCVDLMVKLFDGLQRTGNSRYQRVPSGIACSVVPV